MVASEILGPVYELYIIHIIHDNFHRRRVNRLKAIETTIWYFDASADTVASWELLQPSYFFKRKRV